MVGLVPKVLAVSLILIILFLAMAYAEPKVLLRTRLINGIYKGSVRGQWLKLEIRGQATIESFEEEGLIKFYIYAIGKGTLAINFTTIQCCIYLLKDGQSVILVGKGELKQIFLFYNGTILVGWMKV
ncbi:MAG: hypothetical protein B6U69_01960 [Thermofilum sp. ex4484_15]|nr:MAG: hypothetical protein B6U69_01960 [Thermofilum sp. ex4484_15]